MGGNHSLFQENHSDDGCRTKLGDAGLMLPKIVQLLFALVAASCGGGGDTPTDAAPDPSPAPSPTPSSGRWLVAEAGAVVSAGNVVYADGFSQPSVSKNMIAVDASNGRVTKVVESAGSWAPISTFDTARDAYLTARSNGVGGFSEIRRAYTLYSKGGRLMKIDHQMSGDPNPQALGNISLAEICGVPGIDNSFQDLNAPGSSYLFYLRPDDSGKCNIASWATQAVRMNMSPTDHSITTGKPLAAIRNRNGSITGYLIQSGSVLSPGPLQRVDANLQHPTVISGYPLLGVAHFVFGSAAPGVFVFSLADTLYGMNLQDFSIRPLAVSNGLSSVSLIAVRDGPNAYVSLGEQGSTTIVRVGEDLSASVVGTIVAGGGTTIHELDVTDSHVIARVGKRFWSVPKSGGTASVLIDVPTVPTAIAPVHPVFSGVALQPNRYFVTAGELVWFNVSTSFSAVTDRMYKIRGDGSNKVVIDNAKIISSTWASSRGWMARNQAEAVFVMEGWSATKAWGGALVRAYEGATGLPRFDVGRIPEAALATVHVDDPVGDPIQYGGSGIIGYGLIWSDSILSYMTDRSGFYP